MTENEIGKIVVDCAERNAWNLVLACIEEFSHKGTKAQS